MKERLAILLIVTLNLAFCQISTDGPLYVNYLEVDPFPI